MSLRMDSLGTFLCGNGGENRIQGSDSKGIVSGDCNAVGRWLLGLKDDVAAHLMDLQVFPALREVLDQIISAQDREGVSCDGQHLITDQVKADGSRRNGVEIEGLHSLPDVVFQLFPAIGLGEDALAEGFGGVAAVGLLRDFKDEFLHAV